jgi:antitoxin YefM
MQAITYEYARNNFDRVFNMISTQNDGLIIVKEDKNYVLMDKDMLDSVMETIDISKDKEFVLSLKKAKKEIEKGESFTFKEVFGEEI